MTEPTPSTAVATRRPPTPLAILVGEVKKRENEFAAALPAHVPPDRFMRVTIGAIANTKDIAQCSAKSVITECMKAASDGLVIDNREATLVKFGNDAKYIPMVAGLMKMARNSGEISSMSAVLVHAKDAFSYNPGVDDVPDHTPDWFGDRGEPVGVYSVVRLKDGCAIVEVMSKAQVMKIASSTRNKDQYDPAKGASWAEWWRKCVLRRISKYLPRSTDREGQPDFIEAVRRDDDLYEPPTDGAPVVDKPPRKKRGAGAAALAAPVTPSAQPYGDPEPQIPDFLRRTPEAPETPVSEQDAEDDGEDEGRDGPEDDDVI